MPKEFNISDAVCGGAEGGMSLDDAREQLLGLGETTNVTLAVVGIVCIVIAVIMLIYKVATWMMGTENAINANSSVALVQFSAGAVGGNTSSTPLDLYGTSVYARNLQDVDQFGYNDIDPKAAPGEPGSAAWFVLNSDIVKCGSGVDPKNPWGWMLSEGKGNNASVASHPAVIATKQAVAVSKSALIDNDASVKDARRKAISSNPKIANNAIAVELSPQVVAAKDALLNRQPDVMIVVKSLLDQATNAINGAVSNSAGTEKKEGLAPSSQCPTIGRRMGDEPLTMSLMGY